MEIEKTFARDDPNSESKIAVITLHTDTPSGNWAVCDIQCPQTIHPRENLRRVSQNPEEGAVVLCAAIDLTGKTDPNKKLTVITGRNYPKCAFPQGRQVFPA